MNLKRISEVYKYSFHLAGISLKKISFSLYDVNNTYMELNVCRLQVQNKKT